MPIQLRDGRHAVLVRDYTNLNTLLFGLVDNIVESNKSIDKFR